MLTVRECPPSSRDSAAPKAARSGIPCGGQTDGLEALFPRQLTAVEELHDGENERWHDDQYHDV